jgi:hypothetical protein
MVIEFVFYSVVEIIRSIKDKPRLFIYELLFKGFSEKDEKQYQLKGRLVGDTKHYYRFKSIKFKLPSDSNCKCRWENDTWCNCCKEENQWEPKGGTIVPNIEGNILTINLEDLEILGKSTTYDIVGNYTVSKSSEDLSYSSLKVYSKKINKKGEEKKEKLKVIKCPNIRKSWLLFYIFFSMMILYIGIASAWICINNWDYIVNVKNASLGTNLLFGIATIILFLFFGIILISFSLFFLCVYWKSLSGYIILMQMKKFGVPPKTEKVSEKYLIPKIFEYMTGTESVDNIL